MKLYPNFKIPLSKFVITPTFFMLIGQNLVTLLKYIHFGLFSICYLRIVEQSISFSFLCQLCNDDLVLYQIFHPNEWHLNFKSFPSDASTLHIWWHHAFMLLYNSHVCIVFLVQGLRLCRIRSLINVNAKLYPKRLSR